MPSVSKVKLNICGSEYAITSDETEEYVRELAGQVDRDMRALLHADDRISTTMAAVLVAITNADSAKKAEDAADNLRAQMKGYLEMCIRDSPGAVCHAGRCADGGGAV